MLRWIIKNKFCVSKAVAILGVILVAVFLLPNNALAQSVAAQNSTLNQGLQVIQQPLGLANFDIRLIIANIIKVALGLVGIVMVCLMLYAGYLWMTSGGNEEQITQAKGIIKNATIGLAIMLSAYAIVAFVMSLLGIGGGSGNGGNINATPNYNFAGSGALGKVIRDHYPARDQVDVPRNTNIVISFTKSLYLPSFVTDTNGNNIFGDCINTTSSDFNWNTDCDHVKLGADNKLSNDFINIKRLDLNQSIIGIVALATDSSTLKLKPITDTDPANATGGYLGSDSIDVKYSVYLGKSIQEDAPNYPSIFDKQLVGNDYYEWNFTTNNKLDLTPPYVIAQSVYPAPNASSSRNSIIQLTFSEPVDPTGLQGGFASTSDSGGSYFVAPGNSSNHYLYLKNASNTLPMGSFDLVNNFKTLEFTPSVKCGVNSCGEDIFCIDPTNYTMLLQAASTLNSSTFQAHFFTGITDMANNALDSDPLGTVNAAPTSLPVFTGSGVGGWKVPDNYYWNFNIKNEIDTSSPYLVKITPGIDNEFVSKTAPLTLEFNKRMNVGSLYSTNIIEYPTVPPVGQSSWIPLWHVISVDPTAQSTTVNHGDFLNNEDYLPYITSTVRDINMNCFYPGVGPVKVSDSQHAIDSTICDGVANDGNCCAVVEGGADFCCNSDATSTSVNGCFNKVKSDKGL